MPLNKVKPGSNMYQWITHTWNPIGGECSHKCTYCSTQKLIKRYPVLKKKYSQPIHLVESELKTNLGKDNTIFVCAQHDLFANDIPYKWVIRILNYLITQQERGANNTYLFQSKNPALFLEFMGFFPVNPIFGTTIESNIEYPDISKAPTVFNRMLNMQLISKIGHRTMVTIEPILDFDVEPLVEIIERINPEWVNIGAATGNHNLPEPSKKKVAQLIYQLPDIKIKTNLNRLLK